VLACVPGEEVVHLRCDLLAVGFEGEVRGVDQMDVERLQVALCGSAPAGGKI
jgi:hypothetical protein